jgi:hypothetical protein
MAWKYLRLGSFGDLARRVWKWSNYDFDVHCLDSRYVT